MRGVRGNWQPRILLRFLFRESEWKARAGEKQFEGRKVRAWVTFVVLEGNPSRGAGTGGVSRGVRAGGGFGIRLKCSLCGWGCGVGWGWGVTQRGQEEEKKKRERSTSGKCWPLLKRTQQRRPERAKGQEKAATWQPREEDLLFLCLKKLRVGKRGAS